MARSSGGKLPSCVGGAHGTDRRNIRRIVFSSLRKSNGVSVVPLTVAQIKQIAGRAGRYNSRYPDGWVTWYATRWSSCRSAPGGCSCAASSLDAFSVLACRPRTCPTCVAL